MSINESKQCSKCRTTKPIDKFATDKRNATGRGAWCYACCRAYQKSRCGTHPLTEQTCAQCHILKPISMFSKSSSTRSGHAYSCKECAKVANVVYKQSAQWKKLLQERKERHEILVIDQRCSRCKITRKAEEFYKSVYTRSGLQSECKKCCRRRGQLPETKKQIRERVQQHRLNNKEKYLQREREYRKRRMATPEGRRSTRNSRLKSLYGITIEQYDLLLAMQEGVCAICQQPPKDEWLHVDHCHNTGDIRGLLCALCNRILGVWKDSPQIAQRSVLYLQRELFHTIMPPPNSKDESPV